MRIETDVWQDHLGVEVDSVEGDLAETENSFAGDKSSSGVGGAPEEQSRISTVDEVVFVAARWHGWMCTEKELWLALRKRRQQQGGRETWTKESNTCVQGFSGMLGFCD